MNIATKNIITEQKLLAITKNSTDVIFLCDLRLHSTKQIVACQEITKKLHLMGYKFIHNSPSSSRGVGVLIKKSALENLIIHNTLRDLEGNFILLDIEHYSHRYTIGSVYGCNTNEGINMYDNLQRDILSLKNKTLILGGDWNASYDCSPVNENIDVLNMANIPSLRRSNRIRDLCTDLDLTDPYRHLYPNNREYTFVPSGDRQLNRSRLDLFIISCDLSAHVKNVTIPHSLSSTVFDHKCVSLIFSKQANSFNYFVKDNYINSEEFGVGVHIAVVECFIQHCVVDGNFSEDQKREVLLQIGTLTQNLFEIDELKTREAMDGPTPLLTMLIEGKRGEIRGNLENLPSMEFLDSLTLTHTHDIFLETLILCVKNNALQEQRRLIKIKNLKKSDLISRVKSLKKVNFEDRDNNAIFRAEAALSNFVEKELKNELENYKKFELLNAERITPHFMSLVKNSTKNDCPTKICNNDGVPFENTADLKQHIGDYFKNIYKKVDNGNFLGNVENINNFLGDEIVGKREVVNAKLTEAEKLDLDLPLTIEELTASINKSNLKSAPGSNSISNKFIKWYWDFFKWPLLKYANYAFATGRLTNSFHTADIKLIPKKGGDLKHIKNWRPISLLNCFYKCISRAFSERLNKYMNKLTPCSQKGYANGRYCQEVLIGVIDNIETCKSKKLKGLF